MAAQRVRPDRRGVFLTRLCRENADLRKRVEELLARLEATGGFTWTSQATGSGSLGLSRIPSDPVAGRAPAMFPAGHVIARRYRVVSPLGRGGTGVVYRAQDVVLERDVAVKVSAAPAADGADRADLEALTLRRLRVPGVVSLHENGIHERYRYIVMDLVRGTPFPGGAGPRPWPELKEPLTALLETLMRIHAQGVVHGDLKPANVLVDEAGVPVVLDVGTAGGPDAAQSRRGSRRAIEGTLAYMAPERFAGAPVSVATDLYALGVMLSEALTGVVPHGPVWDPDFVSRRSTESAPPLTGVPDAARGLAEALLRREPAQRPAGAFEALRFLEDRRESKHSGAELPWLGPRTAVEALLEAARGGRSLAVWGPQGSGKSRTLAEAARLLAVEGRTTRFARGSTEPLGSLRPVLLPAESHASSSRLEDHDVETRLMALLASGIVVVADPLEAIDARSRAVLAACRPAGCVWWASSNRTEGAVPIPRLVAVDLEPLFVGPRRLFHLPEDAASELFRRTNGLPRAAAEEVGAWVRSGLATWDAGRLSISRASITRLAAEPLPATHIAADGISVVTDHGSAETYELVGLLGGSAPIDLLRRLSGLGATDFSASLGLLERTGAVRVDDAAFVHFRREGPRVRSERAFDVPALNARIAACLEESDPRRLIHHRAAGQVNEFAAALLALSASDAIDLGRARQFADLCLVAQWRRAQAGTAQDDAVATNLLRAALLGGTRNTLEIALHELALSPRDSGEVRGATLVAQVALKALAGEPRAALSALEALHATWSTRLCACAESVRVFAARSCPVEVEERVIAEAAGRLDRLGRDAALDDWLGWLRYRQGRFPEAAALHLRQAERWPTGYVARIASRLAAASALMEHGDLVQARAIVDAAWDELRTTRNANFEARAEWMRRSCAYRLGEPITVDPDLVEALRVLDQPHVAALSLLTEAAVAWRAQQLELIPHLLHEASLKARSIDRLPLRTLIDAFTLHFVATPSPAEVQTAVTSARTMPFGLRAQVVALLAAKAGVPAEDLADVRRLCEAMPADLRTRRREILTYDEVLAHLSSFSPWRTADARPSLS